VAAAPAINDFPQLWGSTKRMIIVTKIKVTKTNPILGNKNAYTHIPPMTRITFRIAILVSQISPAFFENN